MSALHMHAVYSNPHRLTRQKAQFNSMPKIFASSETQGLKVLDNPDVVRLYPCLLAL